ncbi:hypothetical protein AB6869_05780 [Rahnella rivi]|uniref:hypothetical protein n=1 Tax=Rahnella TaxID=34037 RepID=UPI000A44F821|nr:hypothetical protein [Rahnella rivi]MBB6117320.1 hypothetical protein [Rahnella inusitata]MBU9830606.1 hypothetical protein [Rahnella rivi]
MNVEEDDRKLSGTVSEGRNFVRKTPVWPKKHLLISPEGFKKPELNPENCIY